MNGFSNLLLVSLWKHFVSLAWHWETFYEYLKGAFDISLGKLKCRQFEKTMIIFLQNYLSLQTVSHSCWWNALEKSIVLSFSFRIRHSLNEITYQTHFFQIFHPSLRHLLSFTKVWIVRLTKKAVPTRTRCLSYHANGILNFESLLFSQFVSGLAFSLT